MGLELIRAVEADIPFVMATERLDGYDENVGRWEEARHYSAIVDGRHAYFLGRDGDESVGFVILRDWHSADRVTLLKRIAIKRPGQGYGRQILRLVVDEVFKQTLTHRLWLGVFPANLRARRTYQAVGVVEEGVARGSAFFGGLHRDELVMSILRTEWSQPRSFPGR